MKIAHMKKRLEILKPVLNEDSYGGMVTEYVPAGKIWAELKRIDYSEQEKLGTPVNKEQLRFRLRSSCQICCSLAFCAARLLLFTPPCFTQYF